MLLHLRLLATAPSLHSTDTEPTVKSLINFVECKFSTTTSNDGDTNTVTGELTTQAAEAARLDGNGDNDNNDCEYQMPFRSVFGVWLICFAARV